MKKLFIILITTLLTQPLLAADNWQLFRSGDAFDLKSNELRYSEKHYMRCSAPDSVRVDYFDKGALFAQKNLNFQADNFVPELAFRDLRLNKRIDLLLQGQQVRVQTDDEHANLPLSRQLVADAGFDRFIAAHATALAAGEPQYFDFVSPTRLDSYRFVVRQQAAADGLALLLQPEAKWLQWLLEPIYLQYQTNPVRLLQYAGISNIEDLQENYLHVRIQYQYYAVCGLQGS